ncbi:hypothetical protein [Streptomyces sp. NPDC056401]|uniref:hypothetical protein n=1 Tax=Streptomyces sp. NPDC056401 TaxID=3345809 RepID=UPI0035D8992D
MSGSLFQEEVRCRGVFVGEGGDRVRREQGGERGRLGELAQEGDGLPAVDGGPRVAQGGLGEQLAGDERGLLQHARGPDRLRQALRTRSGLPLEAIESVHDVEQALSEGEQFIVKGEFVRQRVPPGGGG